jgi:hypothetical protein
MGSAVRQYLEMRFNEIGASNPAKPREIFDALKQGGFHFEAKDDAIAIISLRNLLRKNTNMFTKVPNSGTYGLATWYEHVKRAKQAAGATDSDADEGLGAGDPEETEAATTDKIAAAS